MQLFNEISRITGIKTPSFNDSIDVYINEIKKSCNCNKNLLKETQKYKDVLKESENYFRLPKRQSSLQEYQRGISDDGYAVDLRGMVLSGITVRPKKDATERFTRMIKFIITDQDKNPYLSCKEKYDLKKSKLILEKWIKDAKKEGIKSTKECIIDYLMNKVLSDKSATIKTQLLPLALELKHSIKRDCKISNSNIPEADNNTLINPGMINPMCPPLIPGVCFPDLLKEQICFLNMLQLLSMTSMMMFPFMCMGMGGFMGMPPFLF